ncbi:MAG: hypothetical protein JXR67_12870 [Bacteroidales bacterium]|nr:hypothetical protein [Bacteroidales bacterium]
MNIKVIPVVVLLSLVAFASCGKIESLPPEPYIEYTSFTVFDTLDQLGNQVRSGRLKFYFEDGDGDLGLNAPEGTEESDTINLFIELFRMEEGKSSPAQEDDPYRVKGFRIPYMEREGRNKILRGDISVDFSYYENSAEDSIIYDFYIRDRAGNISNTESTSVIPVFYPGIYAE